ncbi:MAG: hypothetical protein EPO21_18295 [Chloroflexota bacterium]|nr:MAG: hypothetical protein EPO21_18295 [Chloroflexota bacterium]
MQAEGAEVWRGLHEIWQVIEQQLTQAELDGFVAAYFLARYGNEDQRSKLTGKLTELRDRYAFARAHVAMLGIALESGWLQPSEEMVNHFVAGYDRLARQQTGPGLALQESLKLLWGVALGAKFQPVLLSRPDILDHIIGVIANFRTLERDHPREYILATALLTDLRSDQNAALGLDLRYYLLGLNADGLSDRDAVATLWALRSLATAADQSMAADAELSSLCHRLMPRLIRIGQAEDILDALLVHRLHVELVQDLGNGGSLPQDALSTVLRTVDTFPELARRMRERKYRRPPLVIENEYDVQDLLYVGLKPHIPDVSDEEWTAKDGGQAKRIDFVSARARLCLEAKMPRDREHAKKIADELKIDIESYYVHSACKTLVVFIFDPEGYMADARNQEAQLSGPRTIKGRNIDVLVRIRPR